MGHFVRTGSTKIDRREITRNFGKNARNERLLDSSVMPTLVDEGKDYAS